MAKPKKLSADEQAALDQLRSQGAGGAPPPAAKGTLWSRRDLFGRLGWTGFTIFTSVGLLAFARSAFPRVLFTPPSTFKAGFPSEYTIGEISERFKQEHRVWIIREADGFYALFAKCTHLGCTPRWLKVEEKFKCPCHGSGFRKTGINFEGPAPRPLERYRMALTEDGQLMVDMSVVYRFERGDWERPGAFLQA
ncbi:MAG: ubiquinol-cytochrome c reductase iron-sulfur subunit [Candidatus Binatia bacterium]